MWVEITTLVIPGANDDEPQLRALARWVVRELGTDVPLHFSAFHPDHRMLDVPGTPLSTLVRARDVAREEGVRYVYTGNVHHRQGDVTSCHACDRELIVRDWYAIQEFDLTPDGRCPGCGTAVPGRFEVAPGDFGPRRIPIRISRTWAQRAQELDPPSGLDGLDGLDGLGLDSEKAGSFDLAVKASTAVRGFAWHAGCPLFADQIAQADASIVATLRAHGARVVGTTNMHEMAMGITSANGWLGPVPNPVDPARPR